MAGFSGKAIYDTGVFENIAEDVSDIITMISPFETPLLSALGDADRPAANVYHEWLEDELSPNTIIASCDVASTAAATLLGIRGGLAEFLQVGAILMGPTASGNEYMQITAINGNTITVARGVSSTTPNSFAAGESISVVTDNALEGADVAEDTSRARSRTGNYCMIVKKDVIISGTTRAVTMLGGIQDEWTYQVQKKLRETLRDLEKAVILSKLTGNTLGSASGYRTMAGMLAMITTNVSSWGTLTDSALTSSWKLAWDNGGTDCNLLLCGDTVKRVIDQFNGTRVQVIQGSPGEPSFRNLVSIFECTYGAAPVMLSRWMPANKFALISTERVKVVPLQGRSFQFQEVSKTGDSTKGMVLGEYTLELRNQAGMVSGKVG